MECSVEAARFSLKEKASDGSIPSTPANLLVGNGPAVDSLIVPDRFLSESGNELPLTTVKLLLGEMPVARFVSSILTASTKFCSNITASCAPASVGYRELNVEIHSYYVIVCSYSETGYNVTLRRLNFWFKSKWERQFINGPIV